MKKAFKFAGVVMTSLVLLFASCSNDSVSIDTNATRNPDVVAIAYPGFNRVMWSPVTDGKTLRIVRDDGYSEDVSSEYGFDDYRVEDGVEYTYTLYTGSTKFENTETKVGNTTSVKVKAIKPAYFVDGKQTSALDLVNYEGGKDVSEVVVTKENIEVNSDGEKIFVQVPRKAYLGYAVKVYKGNSYEMIPTVTMDVDQYGNWISFTGNQSKPVTPRAAINKDKIKTDSTGFYSTQILGAGEYRVVVTVKSPDSLYATDEITAAKTVKIEAVETAVGTQNVKAYLFDNENTKARVMWIPAKDKDYNFYPANNYTVYAFNPNTNELRKVEGEIETGKNSGYKDQYNNTIYNQDVYYVDTTTVDKRYVVVLSVNGKYENANLSVITSDDLIWYEEPKAINWINENGDFVSKGEDGKSNDFVIDIYDIANQDVGLKYFTYDPDFVDYSSYNDNEFSSIFVSADYVFDKNPIMIKPNPDVDYYYYESVIENVPAGHKVAYQITVSEKGKKSVVNAYISDEKSRD